MSRILETKENQITQHFGNNGHSGVDLVGQGSSIDNIIAHSDGKVVFCQTGQRNNQGSSGNASYGNCIKLQHSNGYYTLYAHLESVSVGLGQQVKKGQVIGRMGNTGNSYGAHLHFEVFNAGGSRINPEPYMNADLPNMAAPVVNNNVSEYKVVYGDTLSGIAQRFGTTIDNLVRLNNIADPNKIVAGQILKINSSDEYYKIPNYNGGSIVEALNSIGVDSSFNNRKNIAVKNNIFNYAGTATQNIQLLDKLKAGKLKK